jgi:hypothetical protein
LLKLREHIGVHIILRDLINNANTCGYCGGDECNIQLKKTSGFGTHVTLGPYSNCKYFVKFSLAAAKKSKPKKPCTNHPSKCELCDMTMWSYNIRSHYIAIHPDHDIPSFISDEEMNRMRNIVI